MGRARAPSLRRVPRVLASSANLRHRVLPRGLIPTPSCTSRPRPHLALARGSRARAQLDLPVLLLALPARGWLAPGCHLWRRASRLPELLPGRAAAGHAALHCGGTAESPVVRARTGGVARGRGPGKRAGRRARRARRRSLAALVPYALLACQPAAPGLSLRAAPCDLQLGARP